MSGKFFVIIFEIFKYIKYINYIKNIFKYFFDSKIIARFMFRIDPYRTVWSTYDKWIHYIFGKRVKWWHLLNCKYQTNKSYCNHIIEKQKKNRTSKADLQRCFNTEVFWKFGFYWKLNFFIGNALRKFCQKYWGQLLCRTPLGSNFWASDDSYSFLEIRPIWALTIFALS